MSYITTTSRVHWLTRFISTKFSPLSSALDSHCQTKHHVPPSIHSTSSSPPLAPVPDDRSNYIFMLFRHEAVRDCSGDQFVPRPRHRVRNGKCYLLGITLARRRTRNSDNEMRFHDCERVRGTISRPRYFVRSDVIIARRDFHPGRSNLGGLSEKHLSPKVNIRSVLYPWLSNRKRNVNVIHT